MLDRVVVPVKRFWLFAGGMFDYSKGAIEKYKASFTSIEQAEEASINLFRKYPGEIDYVEIIDVEFWTIKVGTIPEEEEKIQTVEWTNWSRLNPSIQPKYIH